MRKEICEPTTDEGRRGSRSTSRTGPSIAERGKNVLRGALHTLHRRTHPVFLRFSLRLGASAVNHSSPSCFGLLTTPRPVDGPEHAFCYAVACPRLGSGGVMKLAVSRRKFFPTSMAALATTAFARPAEAQTRSRAATACPRQWRRQ